MLVLEVLFVVILLAILVPLILRLWGVDFGGATPGTDSKKQTEDAKE